MTIPLVVERMESRQGSWGENPTSTLRYQVTGTTDDALAVAMVDSYAPSLYYGLYKQSININPGEAADVWYCDAQYGPLPKPEPGNVQWQFQLGGGTVHISNALNHIHSYAASGTPPDHQGAINVRKDGNGELVVDGVDIGGTGGALTWSETHWMATASFTAGYVNTLYNLKTNTPVNNAAWRIWAPGEVRLVGVSGQAAGEDQVELTFHFAAEPNVTNLTIGDINGIAKQGWEYLWVEYTTESDAASHTLVKHPLAVHVEQVYGTGDFSAIGLANVPWGS